MSVPRGPRSRNLPSTVRALRRPTVSHRIIGLSLPGKACQVVASGGEHPAIRKESQRVPLSAKSQIRGADPFAGLGVPSLATLVGATAPDDQNASVEQADRSV